MFDNFAKRAVSCAAAWLIAASVAAEAGQFSAPKSSSTSVSGDLLVRVDDGRAIWSAPSATVPFRWTVGPALSDASVSAGWRITKLDCDPVLTGSCLVSLARGASDRRLLVPVEVTTPGTIPVENAGPRNIFSLAFDSKRRIGWFAANKMGGDATNDVTPGVYVWRTDPAINEATRHPEEGDDSALHLASVRPANPAGTLLINRGDSHHWDLFNAEGSKILWRMGTPGMFLFDDASGIYYARDGSDEGDLSAFRLVPTDGKSEPAEEPIYEARTGDSDRPPLSYSAAIGPVSLGYGGEERVLARLASGALIAITAADGLHQLREICRPAIGAPAIAMRNPVLDAVATAGVEYSLQAKGWRPTAVIVRRLSIAGALTQAVVADDRPVSETTFPPICGTTRLRAIALPADVNNRDVAERLPAGVTLRTNETKADDGTRIVYRLIGAPDRPGRTMVRVYGASGLRVIPAPQTDFERAWIQQGNTLVIPTLRGDGGPTGAWRTAGQGDYKKRTAADLNAVVRALEAGGVAKAGEIILAGVSAGGFVAAREALDHPEHYRAAILISAVLDINLLVAQMPDKVVEFGPAVGGFDDWFGGPRPAGDHPPFFLIIHAKDDDRVSVENALSFVGFLKSKHYKGAMTLTETGGHEVADAPDVSRWIMENLPNESH